MSKIFHDHHHSSLTRSLTMLFQDRLGIETYSPIGIEWFGAGYWAINDQLDTARQYLDLGSQPLDGTPPLTQMSYAADNGVYDIYDPGNKTTHKGIRFDAFKETKFDYLIASIPQHIPLYADLIAKYQPQAKLIVQVGNNWDLGLLDGQNVLASVKSVYERNPMSVCYYRQEFDTNIFCRPDERFPAELRVSSYVNCLSEWPVGGSDFLRLEKDVTERWNSYGNVFFSSFGGQCRDGNMNGPHELAASMQKDALVFHVKDYGDGYGHIVHNALACGRPIIYRSRFTDGTLVGALLNDSNSFDLDEGYWKDNVENIMYALDDQYALESMSEQAYKSFRKNVDFADDARRVGEWLQTL